MHKLIYKFEKKLTPNENIYLRERNQLHAWVVQFYMCVWCKNFFKRDTSSARAASHKDTSMRIRNGNLYIVIFLYNSTKRFADFFFLSREEIKCNN